MLTVFVSTVFGQYLRQDQFMKPQDTDSSNTLGGYWNFVLDTTAVLCTVDSNGVVTRYLTESDGALWDTTGGIYRPIATELPLIYDYGINQLVIDTAIFIGDFDTYYIGHDTANTFINSNRFINFTDKASTIQSDVQYTDEEAKFVLQRNYFSGANTSVEATVEDSATNLIGKFNTVIINDAGSIVDRLFYHNGLFSIDFNDYVAGNRVALQNMHGRLSQDYTNSGADFNGYYIDTNLVRLYYDADSSDDYSGSTADVKLTVNKNGVAIGGRILNSQGADVASANTLTLGYDGNSFVVTGTTSINYITTTGWTDGSRITLHFEGSVTLNDNTGTVPANTAAMRLDAATVNMTAGDNITFELITIGVDRYWREVAMTSL